MVLGGGLWVGCLLWVWFKLVTCVSLVARLALDECFYKKRVVVLGLEPRRFGS